MEPRSTGISYTMNVFESSLGATEIASGIASTAHWLLASFVLGGGQGSAAWQSQYLHPLTGWARAYPETTGYIIPTLFDLAARDQDIYREFAVTAAAAARWLISLQLPNGAFPGGHYAGRGQCYLSTKDYILRRRRDASPSIFNSAQILHGLLRYWRETSDPVAHEALVRCMAFLETSIRGDGTWASDAYAGETSPSYFALVSARLLEAQRGTGVDPSPRVIASIDNVIRRLDSNTGWIQRTGFGGREKAFTHTIGYTIEGLLLSARYLGSAGEHVRELAQRSLERLFRYVELNKWLPGAFSAGWIPDVGFQCVTGTCQVGLCFLIIHSESQDLRYLNAACRLYTEVSRSVTRTGAVPGSVPIWGPYMSFRYPNWAAKYYIDFGIALQSALETEWRR